MKDDGTATSSAGTGSTDSLYTLDNADYQLLLQTLNVAAAVVDADDFSVLYENAAMFRWFPPTADPDESLPLRIPGFNTERARSRVANGREYTFEAISDPDGKKVPIQITVRALADGGNGKLVVEGHNDAKRKQAEYMLESYSRLAENNARALEKEKSRVERLLLNVMPRSVYEEMNDYGTVTPKLFEAASILMIDFVGHTNMELAKDPASLVTELNDIFNVFDRITDLFSCERIRTVGDGYVAVSGMPDEVPDHAHNVARVALRMLRYINKRNIAHAEKWECRIGINTGPVVGSLVGVQKYVYDIFGPGVNMAARMESLSEPMKITISEHTYQLIKDEFECVERGEFEVKGFGQNKLYFLERER